MWYWRVYDLQPHHVTVMPRHHTMTQTWEITAIISVFDRVVRLIVVQIEDGKKGGIQNGRLGFVFGLDIVSAVGLQVIPNCDCVALQRGNFVCVSVTVVCACLCLPRRAHVCVFWALVIYM